jgi:hypothetical protein
MGMAVDPFGYHEPGKDNRKSETLHRIITLSALSQNSEQKLGDKVENDK